MAKSKRSVFSHDEVQHTEQMLKNLSMVSGKSEAEVIRSLIISAHENLSESLAGTVRVPAATEHGRHVVVVQHVDGSREVDPIIR